MREPEQLMRRSVVGVVVVAASAMLAAMACTTDYQLGKDDPAFGGPNALAGQKAPSASSELTAQQTGGDTSAPFACVTAGGTLVDGGATCPVSFKNDILPAFAASTCAQAACHGGKTPLNEPRIDPAEPEAIYPIFAVFKMSAGNLPYINPCSTDKTKSGIACNLYATGTCGVKMPQGGTQMDQAVIDKIEQWLTCGSPNN